MESASLSSLDNLTHLARRGGVDMRPTLLRVLTDLYVQKLTHTPNEERHYTELALRLLDAVDVATRAAVAGRLGRHLSPPVQVIQQLAADLPEVAAAVRTHPVLQRKPQSNAAAAPAPAIAEIHEAVQETGVCKAEVLEANVDQPREREAYEDKMHLVAQSRHLIAGDVACELNELFFAASADERRLILLNLKIAVPIPSGHVEFVRDAAVGQRLETAVLSHSSEDFAQHLAYSLQIPRSQARRIAGDTLGEPIVVATKALNLPRDVVYRILLFVNTTVGHSVERVHTLATLYDEMPIQAAEHMVAIWQSLQRNELALTQHRPLLWNDEARARARTATEAVRRAPAAQRSGERRDAS